VTSSPTDSVYMGRAERLGALERLHSGKVRDVYGVDDDHLLFVTSDRVSAFDVLMPQGIPAKGRVLTQVAAHWFDRTDEIVPNHLVSTAVDDLPDAARLSAEEKELLRGRVMLVKRCEPTTVEWVVRGYLAGSGWKEYRRAGSVCGQPLPAGIEFCGRLPEPLFTPTTKDREHDLAITPDQARERVGVAVYEQARDASLELFRCGSEEMERHGILLADTKFEFGLRDGRLFLIDEALTPDSSRFWPADEYATGRNQPSYDKQILRDWLETLDWDKQPPGPELPPELVERINARYLEICRKITGRDAS